MLKRYECVGALPLDFPDGQSVESGETFTRDFEKSTGGVEHERFLIVTGNIREKIEEPVQATTKKSVAAKE